MISRTRAFVVYFTFLAVAILWNLAIVAAPWTWAHGQTEIASFLYYIFSPLCHQRADRSFFWMGHHFAVCNRCTGIYLGALIGIQVFPFVVQFPEGALSKDGMAKTPPRLLLFVALATVAADVGLDWLGIWQNTPVSRFLTGGFCGIVAAFFLLPPVLEIFTKAANRSSVDAPLEDGASEAQHVHF